MKLFLRVGLFFWCLAVWPMHGRGEEPFSLDRAPGQLPKTVTPVEYLLRIVLEIEQGKVTGSAQIKVQVREPVRQIVLNSAGLTIQKATLQAPDGVVRELTPQPDEQREVLTLSSPDEIVAGVWTVNLEWQGKLSEQPVGLYIMRHKTPAGEKRALASQMQATDARRLFPCWDEPAFRAAFQLTAVVPEAHTALFNMPEERSTALGDGRKEVVFARTPSMVSYLFAFCSGEFESVEGEAEGVKLRVFTTPGKREQARYALEATKQLLPYFNDYFGTPYPLPKLDQISFAGTPASGMENWGLIIYDDTAMLYDPATSSQATKERAYGVIAHEIAHQWFGNLVTMGWWDNLWLNEGFASWMGTKATDRFNPDWKMWLRAAGDKEWAMALDARATTHPIQQAIAHEKQVEDAFDEITYSKGQAFLRMLESYLGEAPFRDGIRAYMKRHAYGNTTTADLWTALEEVSGQPVRAFAAGWTEQPGFPVVTARPAEEGRLELSQERFTIHQKDPAPLAWKIPVVWAPLASLTSSRTALLDEHSPLKIDAPEGGGAVKLNVGGVGYFRAAYAGALGDALFQAAPSLPDADRLNLLQDTLALVKATRLPASRYFDLLSSLAPAERTFTLWEEIIDGLSTIDNFARGEAGRERFREWARSLLKPQLARLGWDAKPGEDALDASLRARVVRALGIWGDAEIAGEARRRWERFLQEPGSLSGDLRASVLAILGKDLDPAGYDRILALGKAEISTEQRRNYYHALASARDQALAQRTLALSITSELPPQEATRLVSMVAFAGEKPELAWEFAKAHLDELLSKLGAIRGSSYVPGLMRNFSEAARADELETFAREHLPPEAGIAVRKAADEIRFRSEFKRRLLPELDVWLEAKRKTP